MADREKAIKRVKKLIVPIEEADPHVKILVYGRNGSQKTRFAATAPKPLFVDINERGTRSAREFHGAEVFHAKKWEEITWAYWFLRESEHEYESVVIDTISQAQEMCMKQVLREREDRDPNREPNMPDQRSYGKLAELMKPVILNFRNLPMHVIFIAQERVVSDDDSETIERVPELTPKSRGIVTGSVDVIGRMYQKEVRSGKGKKEKKIWVPRMLVGPHDEFTTKDRTGALGRIVTNPTVPKILEKAHLLKEEE